MEKWNNSKYQSYLQQLQTGDFTLPLRDTLNNLHAQFHALYEDFIVEEAENRLVTKAEFEEANTIYFQLGHAIVLHLIIDDEQPNEGASSGIISTPSTVNEQQSVGACSAMNNTPNVLDEQSVQINQVNPGDEDIIDLEQNEQFLLDQQENETRERELQERQERERALHELQERANSDRERIEREREMQQSAGPSHLQEQPQMEFDEPFNVMPYKTVLSALNSVITFTPISIVCGLSISRLMNHCQELVSMVEQQRYSFDREEKIVVAMAENKMDEQSRTMWHWDLEDCGQEPTLSVFVKFLAKRQKRLINADLVQELARNMPLDERLEHFCAYCRGAHKLCRCEHFKRLTLRERWTVIERARVCVNCFSKNHLTSNCREGNCKQCKSPHNSLMCSQSYGNK